MLTVLYVSMRYSLLLL